LFRRGGRGWAIESAGTFRTERDARIRRDLVSGWLAAALNPKVELAAMLKPAPPKRTYAGVAEAYKQSRLDHAPGTARNVDTHLNRLLPIFGDLEPEQVTVEVNIAAVALLAPLMAPSSLRKFWQTHMAILDFAQVKPNTARDSAVRLPRVSTVEHNPPTADHVLAILDHASPRRHRLPLILMEQTAMAAGEVAGLEWGDVDLAGSQFRLRRESVKGQIRARARWVQVPEWLMETIVATTPPDDRVQERRVFVGVTPELLRQVMSRACRSAGVPLYSPHDLRHRRISLWHGQGIPAAELAARAGHSKPSMTTDVYSHVLLDSTEVNRDEFERIVK
jgi:integrase